MMISGSNENTYNPECPNFDSELGCCKLDWKACREETCPKENEIVEKLKTEIQKLQFKIIKARSKRNELADKKHRLFIAYSYLEMQEKTEETKRILDNIQSESKTTAEEYLALKNNVDDLEQELNSLLNTAEDKGIKFEAILDPGWVYVFTEEVK